MHYTGDSRHAKYAHLPREQARKKLYFHSDFDPGIFKNFDWTQIDDGNMMFRLLGIASAKRITVTHRIR